MDSQIILATLVKKRAKRALTLVKKFSKAIIRNLQEAMVRASNEETEVLFQ